MKPITLFLLTLFLLGLAVQPVYGQSRANTSMNALLDRYVQSINLADSLAGKEFWSTGAEISFINPRGNEYGWNGIRNIYQMFSETFSARKLVYKDPRWTSYGTFAWVDFNWVFDATFRANGKPLQTRGRETQIWKKEKGKWKLVHVHYSGLPVTAVNQGF